MKTPILLGAVLSLACSSLPAQILFDENFDVDHSANWIVNTSSGNHAANVFFDYSTVGIPAAPGGITTRGLKLEANYSGNITGGVSVSPVGGNFTGDYRVRYHVWQNFNGPAPGGDSGSTQITGVGILGAGNVFQGTNNPASIHFGGTAEGGAAQDYRAYSSATTGTGYGDTSGVFAAGSAAGVRNGNHAYYNVFGGQTAPPDQTTRFPTNSIGTTAAGALGWEWHEVVVEKIGSTVTWSIDGTLLATVNTNGLTFGGNNIFFLQYDINNTSSTDPNVRNLLFGLVDNVVVEAVPEPSTYALAGLAVAGLAFMRRRRQ